MDSPNVARWRYSFDTESLESWETAFAELTGSRHAVALWSAKRKAAASPGQLLDVIDRGQVIGQVEALPRSHPARRFQSVFVGIR